MIHLVFLKGIGGRADESFRAQRALKQRKNEMKIGEKMFLDYLISAILLFYSLKRNRINF